MEFHERQSAPEFTSALTKRELIFVGAGLVLHVFLLPRLLAALIEAGKISEPTGNFVLYAFMALYVVILAWGFLRRDFDPLADRPALVLFEILSGYFSMMCFNFLTALILSLFEQTSNPNNAAILDMAVYSENVTTAMAVFLAPIVEEVLFRGGIFGFFRKYNRIAAYALTAAAFAIYHLWGFIMLDVKNLVYLIQYIPAAIILCRVYERSNTVWCPIGMHMLVNFMSLQTISAVGRMT